MRVFVATDDSFLGQRAREILQHDGHDCEVSPLAPVDMAVSRLARSQAEMLLVGMTPNPDAGQQFLEAVTSSVNGPLLAVGPAGQSKVRLRALQAGADFFFDDAELEA
jgi:DNA-binding response OmpR family regulator